MPCKDYLVVGIRSNDLLLLGLLSGTQYSTGTKYLGSTVQRDLPQGASY